MKLRKLIKKWRLIERLRVEKAIAWRESSFLSTTDPEKAYKYLFIAATINKAIKRLKKL